MIDEPFLLAFLDDLLEFGLPPFSSELIF